MKVTEPLPCVATDAVVWQSLHTAPAPVLVVRCGPCELVASVAEVAPWHSVQLFVPPPSTVFQVYGDTTVVLRPLLWQMFTPQVPNVPPLTATALAAAGVYVKVAAKVTEPLACVATEAVVWQSLQTAPRPVRSSGAARASWSSASSRSLRGTPCSCWCCRPTASPTCTAESRRALPVVVAEVDPAGADRRVRTVVRKRHIPGNLERAVDVPGSRLRPRRAPRHRCVAVRADIPAACCRRHVRLVRQPRRVANVVDVRVAHDARRRVRRRAAVPAEVDPRGRRRRLVVVTVDRRAGPAVGRRPDPVVQRLGQPERVHRVDLGRQGLAVVPVLAGAGVAVRAQLDLLRARGAVRVVGQQLGDGLVVAGQRQFRHVQRVALGLVLGVGVRTVRPVVALARPDGAPAVADIAAARPELVQLDSVRPGGVELDGAGMAAGVVARPGGLVVVGVLAVVGAR